MEYKEYIGLGVAGNFAGHLEQAGEAADFVKVKTENQIQPKAVFPFYVPSCTLGERDLFLATYPLSSSAIHMPSGADNLQIEPEVALICDIQYSGQSVVSLTPRYFAAYNDCSIRRPSASKICEKKNWGENSKGISDNWIKLDVFKCGGNIDSYSIACFHKRNGVMTEYGVNSATIEYSYFHQRLLDWIIDRMNNQPDEGPMNNISDLLARSNYPSRAIISIGATCYTEFGQNNFLQVGDTSIVVVYNNQQYTYEQIIEMAEKNTFNSDVSALVQCVIE